MTQEKKVRSLPSEPVPVKPRPPRHIDGMENLVKTVAADVPKLGVGDKVRLLSGSPAMLIVDVCFTETTKQKYFICAMPGGKTEVSYWPDWLRRDKGRSIW